MGRSVRYSIWLYAILIVSGDLSTRWQMRSQCSGEEEPLRFLRHHTRIATIISP